MGMSITLVSSVGSTALVGERVTWRAAPTEEVPGRLEYRFRARLAGERYRIIRDYAPVNSLDWTASEHEGQYEIEVSVRNVDTNEIAQTTATFDMTSRVTGDTPVISPTAHPLVFLYSAPACSPGNRMRVWFISPDGVTQTTQFKPCREGLSMNFYLAGMRTATDYFVEHTIEKDTILSEGPGMSLTNGDIIPDTPGHTLLALPSSDGTLLFSGGSIFPYSTDLYGNLTWYYPDYISLTRPTRAGRFVGVIQNQGLDRSYQVVREFDVAGYTIQETNAARVSEQLIAMGRSPVTAFHHEAARFPDGKLVVLAASERILRDVQGPGDVNVIGDMIVVLDRDLNVVWAWDAFDHLDVNRKAILNETCAPGAAGCPVYYLTSRANDWTHSNSVQPTPDGNLIISMRHQDWVIKIDYANGKGSGDIIWRLGKDGDFQYDSGEPYPWFSHQHDARFLPGDSSTMILFDNGNTRHFFDDSENSRGQVIQLDEEKRTARLVLNANLGSYAAALGSAQQLSAGKYHFNLGTVSGTSTSVEVDAWGNLIYALQTAGTSYRTFRMETLYTSR